MIRTAACSGERSREMAARYLTPNEVAEYLEYEYTQLGEHIAIYMRPEHWLSADLGPAWGGRRPSRRRSASYRWGTRDPGVGGPPSGTALGLVYSHSDRGTPLAQPVPPASTAAHGCGLERAGRPDAVPYGTGSGWS